MQQKPYDHINRGADLLRQGATLTDLACPVCSSPLFRLKDGSLWCVKDEKKVILIKEGEETSKATTNAAMETLEATLLAKVNDLQGKIQRTDSAEELQKLSSALSDLLSSLEKIRRMKS